MADAFMSKLRSFFGLHTEPPRNDFRNPIWGSNDDDDEEDTIYTNHQMDIYGQDVHREIARQMDRMHDMFKAFGSMFGDMSSFFHNGEFQAFTGVNETPGDSETLNSNNIRDYYLKPGFRHKLDQPKEDIDLDGKISSNEISGLLKRSEDSDDGQIVPFNNVPGRSFCQTIITTSVTKPDGTIETRRIVKKGNEVVEETITSSSPSDSQGSFNPGLNTISSPGVIFSELASLFKNFY